MSSLGVLAQCFRWMAEHGVFDLVTAVGVVVIAVLLKGRRQKPLREIAIHVTHSFGNDSSVFPNTLGFEIRNPLDAPVIVTRPSFSFSRHVGAGSAAQADTMHGEVEMKFRLLLSDGSSASQLSHSTAMLRHREAAFAFVPVQDALTEEQFLQITRHKRIGTLQVDVVLLGQSPPRSLTLRLPIRLSQRAPQEHTFGVDGLARTVRRTSERPGSLPSPAQ